MQRTSGIALGPLNGLRTQPYSKAFIDTFYQTHHLTRRPGLRGHERFCEAIASVSQGRRVLHAHFAIFDELMKRVKPMEEYDRVGGLLLADLSVSSFGWQDATK